MFEHIEVAVPPAEEPVTLAEGIAQARGIVAGDEALFQQKLIAAREKGEQFTRRSLVTQTLDVWYNLMDGIGYFELPRGKVQEVVSLTLFDDAGLPSVVDAAEYSLVGTDLILSGFLPFYRRRRGIKIQIISGYGDADDVPKAIKDGILAYAVHLYEKRMGEAPDAKYEIQASGGLPSTVADLWRPYQIKIV